MAENATAPPFEDTVRSRLLRLAVLLLLPGLSLAAMVTWQSLNADRAALDAQLRDNATLLAAQIDASLAETTAQLRLLAASGTLASGDLAAFAGLARAAGDRIRLTGPDGAILLDTASPAEPGPASANPPPPHPPGPPSLSITLPVRIAGQPKFSLTALPAAFRLQAAIDRIAWRNGWSAAIYDADFRLVAETGRAGLHAGQAAPAPLAAALGATPRPAAALSGAAIVALESPSGGTLLAAVARSPRFAVPLAVMVPLDSLTVPSRVSLLLLVGIGGVLVSLGLLGALVVSGSISRPIEALAAAARRLGESLTVPPIPGGLIEADQVAHAMAGASAALIERSAALTDINATLATRVADRTAELAAANRALEDERARLGVILDHMPIGVLVSQPDGILYVNLEGRRLLGFQAGQNHFPDQKFPVVRRQGVVIPALETPPPLALQGIFTSRDVLTVERADGVTLELEVSAGPVLDQDGRVALAVTTLQDISARLEAEESRRRSQRMEAVGQLTGGVAHEFNNLLMAIGGCLDLLTPHVHNERARAVLENAARATGRGATLTRQLLAFARRQHLQPEPVDLNALVIGLAELLGTTLGRGITVVTELAEDGWPAIADATQLELVLLNLAINARDAMPAGGMLRIGTGNAVRGEPRRAEEPPPGEYATLRVADTGTGMTPDVLARAFEPFFTTKQVGQGTGLGLPQVLGVAQQLGGGVVVDSAPGRGTEIQVFLPRASRMPTAPRRSALRPPRPRALHGMRLLVVDDDAEVREIAHAMLQEMGATVIEADSARQALLLARTEPGLDLVLADYTMPNMTGVELAQQIATLLPGTPVILMTGYSAATLGDIGPPIRAILQKPFRAEAIVAAIAEALPDIAPAR